LLVDGDWWEEKSFIVGFRDFSDEEIVESEPPLPYASWRGELERTFDWLEGQDPSWKAPKVRLGTLF
jgi:hypothetical protein